MFRDLRYVAPLGVLIGVILVSAVLAHESSGRSAAASPAAPAAVSPTSAPESTATPDGATVNAHRLQDLTNLRDVFLAYRRQHGKFPMTKDGITTVCHEAADPGCALASTGANVPFADGDQPYWFISDGSRVVLLAPAQPASGARQCPAALPFPLAAGPLICLQIERPAQ